MRMADVSKINGYNLKDAQARQDLKNKQDKLISGTNIKSINGQSVLGSGDITINGGEVDLSGYVTKDELDLSINKIKMIAHRGYSSQAPENTIPAYELAGMKNYWGAECDVLETSDGHFVLMHDDTVDRTTNGTGKVSSMTLEQIKALVVDINADYENVKVPTLEEYLICCKKYSLVPVIEIKTMNNLERFLNIIKEYDYENSCVIISFNNNILKELRALSKNIKIQTLSFVSIEECVEYDFDIDMAYSNTTEELVKNAHNNGLKVNIWTVNNKQVMDTFISMNVDYITTDTLTILNQVTANDINELVDKFNRLEVKIKRLYELMNESYEEEPVISPTSLVYGRAPTGEIVYPIAYNANPDDLRAYVPMQIFVEDGCKYEVITTSDICVTLHPFDKDNKRIQDLGWLSNGTTITPEDGVYYYIIYIKMSDESSVKDNEALVLSTVKIVKTKVN
jgi:glycerophosphoryl diester phosphodiesterase